MKENPLGKGYVHWTRSTLHNQRLAAPALQGVEVVGEKIWVPGGEGFGTERARLAQGKNLQNFHLRRIRYFWVQNSKNPDSHREFFFVGATLQLVENIKPIR